ncbi:MAG: ectoine hydroxylase [Actinomycetota bacterium]|nr:ectoine hydroxylase [Actinomycetota bacterium]
MAGPTATRDDVYPTRTVDGPSLLPRVDPVVWGDGTDGPLDPEMVASYEDCGYLVLPGLLPPTTLQEIGAELARLAVDDTVKARPQAVIEPGSDELRSLFQVHLGDDAVGRLSRDPRLVSIARQLLGDQVYIHQSRINLKPGFRGKEFYWHSDFETWHAEDGMPRMRAISCSVLLTPNHSFNGPLLTIDRSHHQFVSCPGETPSDHYLTSLRRQDLGVPDDDSLRELVRAGRINSCEGQPGTVVFFDCNVMHGSNGNVTPFERHNVFLVYNAVSNALVEPYGAPAPRPEFIAARDVRPIPE